jgi:divalent metal cation (Fe/Co/Zn/Cd) transporter
MYVAWWLDISVQFVLQNRSDAILSIFLMVGVIFVWYCWKFFSIMMVVLLGSMICSSMVMFDSSS